MDAITFFTASFFFSFLSLFSSAFSSKISPKKGGSVSDLSPPARGRCPVPNLPKNREEAGKTLCCPPRAVCGPGLGGAGSRAWKPGGHAELRGEEPWKLWRQEQCGQSCPGRQLKNIQSSVGFSSATAPSVRWNLGTGGLRGESRTCSIPTHGFSCFPRASS